MIIEGITELDDPAKRSAAEPLERSVVEAQVDESQSIDGIGLDLDFDLHPSAERDARLGLREPDIESSSV